MKGEMTETAGNIMVVEDERGMRVTLVGTLEEQGYRLTAFESGREAIASLQESLPDLVIADLRLRDADGLEILQALKRINPEAAFMVVTSYASIDTAVEALNEGAFAYITKPFNMDELNSTVRNALRQQRLLRENRRLVESLRQSNRELNAEIVQRERAETSLAHSVELRRLQAAQEAKEQERRRLAEELHDETMAELASVVVDLGYLSRQARQVPAEVRQGMAELRKRVRGTERKLRQIVQGIFPSVLTNLGLIPALRSYLEEMSGRPTGSPHPLELELRTTGLDDGRLPEEVEIAVYRTVQQGLTNAIQHARAKALRVELTWAGTELTVLIADDGVGFDVQNLERTPASGHFGLVNLSDRIEGLKGVFEIDSHPMAGTTIQARVPTQDRVSCSTAVHTSVYILGNQDIDRQRL